MKLKRIAGWSALGVGSLLAVDLAFSGSAGSPYGSFVAGALVGLVDQVSTALCTEGQACQTRATPYGALMVTPIDLSGNVITGGGGGGSGGDVNITQVKGSAIDTNTGAASAATLRVVPATGSAVAATQSGTWTVQPGNTANTTPWLVGDGTGPFTVDGTVAATQSGTWTADTELPAAGALADSAANPTAPASASFGLVWNGTTWDRQPGTAAAGTLSDTEMPAAAALATGMANPTAPAIGAFPMLWNGTTWDRMGGSTSAGLTVNTELPAAASITDNLSVSTTTTAAALAMGWDGSNWDRLPGNSSTGLTVNQATGWADVGNVAHDGVDSGNPVKVGMRAVAHGTNPTAVAAGDRTDWLANRAGMPFISCGHPNTLTKEVVVTHSNGAQTNVAIETVSAGTKIVVTQASGFVVSDEPASIVSLRVGLSAATLPAASTTGASGMVLSITQKNGTANSDVNATQDRGDGCGILAIGADGEDLRYTASDPGGVSTDGRIQFIVSYYLIES